MIINKKDVLKDISLNFLTFSCIGKVEWLFATIVDMDPPLPFGTGNLEGNLSFLSAMPNMSAEAMPENFQDKGFEQTVNKRI